MFSRRAAQRPLTALLHFHITPSYTFLLHFYTLDACLAHLLRLSLRWINNHCCHALQAGAQRPLPPPYVRHLYCDLAVRCASAHLPPRQPLHVSTFTLVPATHKPEFQRESC